MDGRIIQLATFANDLRRERHTHAFTAAIAGWLGNNMLFSPSAPPIEQLLVVTMGGQQFPSLGFQTGSV